MPRSISIWRVWKIRGTAAIYGFLALGGMLAVTPGPNMVYVMSRSTAQGHKAALISHAGVMLAYLFYMLGAAFGITALFLGVPFAGSHLGAGGAAYLLYLGLVRRERRWHSAILFSWPYR